MNTRNCWAIAVMLLAGCVSKGKYNGAVQELDEMTQERDALATENAQLAAEKTQTTQERDDLATVAAVQEVEIAAMQADFDRVISMFAMEIESNDLKVKIANGSTVGKKSNIDRVYVVVEYTP